MELARSHLTLLLNALYETDTSTITVAHPSDTIGDLLEIELGDPEESTVTILKDEQAYADARQQVDREHGDPAVDELPQRQSYLNAFLAGGLLAPPNHAEINEFLDRYGSPDLSAGHKPVVAGFDTNLLPWRIADRLDMAPGQTSLVNGFALATGVRDELDWDYKRSDTRPLEEAFGDEFERVWNQPAGANREGRLGELQGLAVVLLRRGLGVDRLADVDPRKGHPPENLGPVAVPGAEATEARQGLPEVAGRPTFVDGHQGAVEGGGVGRLGGRRRGSPQGRREEEKSEHGGPVQSERVHGVEADRSRQREGAATERESRYGGRRGMCPSVRRAAGRRPVSGIGPVPLIRGRSGARRRAAARTASRRLGPASPRRGTAPAR